MAAPWSVEWSALWPTHPPTRPPMLPCMHALAAHPASIDGGGSRLVQVHLIAGIKLC